MKPPDFVSLVVHSCTSRDTRTKVRGRGKICKPRALRVDAAVRQKITIQTSHIWGTRELEFTHLPWQRLPTNNFPQLLKKTLFLLSD